jgi:TP901 family phage tail tape measure protein
MADKIQININTTLRKPNEAEISKFKKDIEKQISQININTSNGKGIKLLDTKEIDLYKQKMNNMLERLKIGKDSIFIKPEIQRQVQEFTNELNKLGTTGAKSTKELGVQFDTLKTNVSKTYAEFNKLNPQMQNMHKHSYDLASMFDMGAKKALIWMAVMNLIYAPIKMLRYAVLTMKEVETQLVSINRVMEDTTFNMQSFGKSLFDIAKSMGSTFKDASDVALRFAQAGYNVNDTLYLTRTAIMAVQTAELNAKNATESLIGIMSQWQLSANDMPLLLDKINYISDQYTVTSQDLVDGLLRSSSAARNLGISIDETISLLTVLRETSGRTGREVGNALNSILSYITRGKTLDVLEKSGISVFADASKTQFRNFMDVLTDIADKWNGISVDVQNGFIQAADEAGLFNEELAETLNLEQEWSDTQRRDISNSAAGTYRKNYFLALMNGFTKTKDVLKDLENAEGYTIAELDKKVKTLDSRFKIFIDTLQQLAVNFGNNGALEFAKTLVDLGTVLVGVIDKFGVLNTILVGTSVYLGMSGTLIKWIPMFKELGIATGVWAISMGASEKAALGLARAMTTLYPLLAVVALWAVVEILDATTVSLEEQTEKVNTLKNSISNLQSEYDKLLTNNNRTDEEQKYLELLEKELELQKANLKTETERLAKQKYFKGDITNTGGVTGIGGINASIYGYGKSGQINQYIADLKRLREELSNSDNLEDSKGIQEKINSIESSLIASRKELKEYIDVLGTDAPPALIALASAIDNIILKTNEQANSANNATNANNSYRTSYEELNKTFETSTNNLMAYNDMIKELEDNHKLSAENVNKIFKDYPQLLAYLGSEQELREQLIKLKDEEARKQRETYIQMIQDSEEFYNLRIKGNVELTNEIKDKYDIDLKNFKTLAEAKEKIENTLLNSLSKKWGTYFDATRNALTYDYNELLRINPDMAKQVYGDVVKYFRTGSEFNDIVGKFVSSDFSALNLSKTGSGSTKEKTLSDYLPREQELLNYIENAQNKIKDLTNEEYEARLKGIKPIEDANNALIDYYKTVRDTLTDKEMIADINSKIIKLEGDNASLAKDRKDLENDIVEAKQKQVEESTKLRKEQQDTLKNLIKEQVETEQKIDKEILEDELDKHQDIIDSIESENEELENQIDKLEAKAEKEDEIAKKKEYQLKIQQAQDRLENLKKEKNVRVLTQNGWEWQYDAIAVKEAEQEVTDIKTQYEDYRRELKLKHQRQELEDQIKTNNKEIQAEKDKMDDLKDAYDNKYKDIELIVDTRMTNMKITQETKLDEMIKTARARLADLRSVYAEMSDVQIEFDDDNNSSSSNSSSNTSSVLGNIWNGFKDLIGLESGGKTVGEGLAFLHDKEIVLNKVDTENILKAVDITRNMIQTPKLPQFSPVGVGGNNSNPTVYNLNIAKVVTEDARSFINELPTLVNQYKK